MEQKPLSDNLADHFEMVATTLFGLEQITANELLRIGAENIVAKNRAVSFTGNIGVMYKANLLLRTALRVLVPIAAFEVANENDLYEKAKSIAWEDFIDTKDTIAIYSVLNTELFSHTQFISQKTKDAIADRFREKFGERPSVDLENPTLQLIVHVFQNKCTISLDSSGESLHKRGYREKTNLAPINEVLAAGLIQLTDWDRRSTFVDGMSGSGTILIEAAHLAANIPAGYHREDFGFFHWHKTLAYNDALWEKIFDSAVEKIYTEEITLYGIELSPNVARKAKENIKRSKTEDMIRIRNADFLHSDAPPRYGKGVLIVNPPYGERMVKDDIDSLYQQIGDTFKQKYTGFDCWMITSNMEAAKHIGLKLTRRIQVFNGQLDCRFLKFSIYEGSKKAKYQEGE